MVLIKRKPSVRFNSIAKNSFARLGDTDEIIDEVNSQGVDLAAAQVDITALQPKYKVYSALLNQNTVTSTSGLLVVGKTYSIHEVLLTDSFANVGFVSIDTPFVATGTTPTVWTNSTVVLNVTDSEPVATILENTIGNIVWTRIGAGMFKASLSNSFPLAKRTVSFGATSSILNSIIEEYTDEERVDDSITIEQKQISDSADTDELSNQFVEIRVYN